MADRAERVKSGGAGSPRLIEGVAITAAGAACWGVSGTAASYLFEVYGADPVWIMALRQPLSGAILLAYALVTDRSRLKALWASPRDLASMGAFAVFGLLFNQLFYLLAVRATNAGTATVLQALSMLAVLGFVCVKARRAPRRREALGVAFAFLGAFFLATGGDPSRLAIPADGLAFGLINAVAAALFTILPARLLPRYGSVAVNASAMMGVGVVTAAAFRPFSHMPSMGADGWIALAVLVAVGSCLAFQLFLHGVAIVGSMRASLLGTIEPISATLGAVLVLGTVFTPADLLGFALIIAMVFLTV